MKLMEEKKLLIVGIDPGITTGYAILDIDGNFIHSNSSKQLDLNILISEIVSFGKIVLVGTDKSKVPNLVGAFATKFGATVLSPRNDLTIEEKRAMTKNFQLKDEHQSDALSSALSAYRQAKPLLDRIDRFAFESEKEGIKSKLKEMVITKRMSIKNAVAMIEKKEEEGRTAAKAVVGENPKKMDFQKLYGKLRRYESEIKILRKYNSKLREEIEALEKQAGKKETREEKSKAPDFRERRIFFLQNLLKSRAKDRERLELLIKKYNSILSNINGFCILKKLDTLGLREFSFKNKALDIKRNDILLVGDPNIVSSEVVDLLKEKVFIIIHKKRLSKKIGQNLPFVFLDAGSLRIDEDRYFGFVDKKHFESEKNKIDWAKKIIEDYKNVRNFQLIDG